MDDASIEKCVLLYIDFRFLFPREGALSVEEQNRYVSEVTRKHPDRLIYFCGIDPRRDDATSLFEKCVTEFGARGLKLYPSTGFLPADRDVYPLYERAAAWGLPVTPTRRFYYEFQSISRSSLWLVPILLMSIGVTC